MFANVEASLVSMTHLKVLCNYTQDEEEEEEKEGKRSSVVLKYLFPKDTII